MEHASLAHKLLIATPAMADPRFHHAVIYVCVHDEEHAMGLIINQPLADLRLDEFLPALGLPSDQAHADYAVMSGGPVDVERGFVLHSDDLYIRDATLPTGPGLAITATKEALLALASHERPRHAAFFLGYAGWGNGQLEQELADNGWLIADADINLIFDTGYADKWQRVLRHMGVDPDRLSLTAGHA